MLLCRALILSADSRHITIKRITTSASKATLGKLLRDGTERIWAIPSA